LLEEDLRADGIELSVAETVRARARVAARAGISGLVCSPQEIDAAREASRDLLLVVPGIRPSGGEGSAYGDQKRVATASQAIFHGADYIVVGRPIRDAGQPARAFADLVDEVDAAAKPIA
jgi:orotidine-5'-phosphate decarboxylase